MCLILLLVLLALICPTSAFQRLVPCKHNSVFGYRKKQPLTERGAAVKFRNFEEMLNTFHDKPVLVSFHTRYCGPCKLMKKELRAVRDEMGDHVHVFAVDTEKWPSLSARYNVAGLPTLVIFYRGEILHRIEGVETADNLVHTINDLF